MKLFRRIFNLTRNFIASYGPAILKRILWNKEYSGDKWNFALETKGDYLYEHLEKYTDKGSILDLGCGSGNTATETNGNSYSLYVGVDISDVCLQKAEKRSIDAGRGDKNKFHRSDFLQYTPGQKFDVILMRESLYLVPMNKIKNTFDKYSKYLTGRGVFIVRMHYGKPRDRKMISIIEKNFKVIVRANYEEEKVTVIVFRQK